MFRLEEGTRYFDFAPWYGINIDELTGACQIQVERFLAKQDADYSPQTVLGYTSSLKKFFEFAHFVSAGSDGFRLAAINHELLGGFVQSLASSGLSAQSQKTVCTGTFCVLAALGRRGLFNVIAEGEDATFPRGSFPGLWNTQSGQKPLRRAEREAFTAALKTEITSLFSDDAVLTWRLAAYAFFVVALYTGRNTSPLLQMPLDCFREHPRKDLTFLVLYKRRAHRWQRTPLKGKRLDEPSEAHELPTANRSVVRVIERVLELNGMLRKGAPAHLAERVWIYPVSEIGQRRHGGKVAALDYHKLGRAVSELVRDHELRDSQGEYLQINVSRLRKTFVNRVSEILGGDLALTAIAAGNSPKVSGTYYLRPGEDAERNWKFLGQSLVNELLTNSVGATEITPTGRCTNTVSGQYAPRREGSTCTNFLNCLRCKNYVVTGDDLYRLFSFYFRVLEERSRIDRRRWNQQLAHIPRLIERDVIAAGIERGVFKREVVEAARERARLERHPFWASHTVIGTLEGLA